MPKPCPIVRELCAPPHRVSEFCGSCKRHTTCPDCFFVLPIGFRRRAARGDGPHWQRAEDGAPEVKEEYVSESWESKRSRGAAAPGNSNCLEKSCKVVTKFGFLKNVYFFKKIWCNFKQKFLFKPIILRLVLGEGGFKGNLPFF